MYLMGNNFGPASMLSTLVHTMSMYGMVHRQTIMRHTKYQIVK